MSNLIVTDSNGKRYRPTGCFREPKPGEYVYCFDHKHVEWRPSSPGQHDNWLWWCSNAHPEFMLHRIICEPLPVEYEVRVRLTQEEFDGLRLDDGKGCSATHAIKQAIEWRNYEEVNS